jgi:hypothetical protein
MPPRLDKKMNIAVPPLDAEAIIERLGKSDEETNVLERLARLEHQHRRLAIYCTIFCFLMGALMFVSMPFSIYLSRGTFALDGKKSEQNVRWINPSQVREKGLPPRKSPDQQKNPVPQEPKTPDPKPPTRNDLPPANVPSFQLGLEPDQPRGPGGA